MTTTVSGSSITFNDNTTQNTSAYGGGFAFRNRIINGDMRIDQRNAGASVTQTAANIYSLDRWVSYGSQASKMTLQQSSTAAVGFTNSIVITSSSAYSITSSDLFIFRQHIEGYNIADLGWGTANAKTVTLSFWVRSSLTGTFGGAIQNGSVNRSYPFTYTISSANTWEQKTVTIAGDTSGTWATDNTTGMRVVFGLGVGSTFSGTAGAWAGAEYYSATGATSVVGTNGATFYITGVQLEKGSTATSFDYRPYGTELALCQRYCFKMSTTSNYGPYGMGHGVNTTNFRVFIKTAQTMRSQPTLSFSSASSFQWSFGNVVTLIQSAEFGVDGFSVGCDSTGISANGGYLLTSANNTTSYILASSEL